MDGEAGMRIRRQQRPLQIPNKEEASCPAYHQEAGARATETNARAEEVAHHPS